ncbi:MAG: hypothetical protein WC059_00825 [Candidatus Paceibacterota bacterium]
MGKRNHQTAEGKELPQHKTEGAESEASPQKVCSLVIETSNGKVLIQALFSNRFQHHVIKPLSHKEPSTLSDEEVIKKTLHKFMGFDYDTKNIKVFTSFELPDGNGKNLHFIPCYLKLQSPIGDVTGNFHLMEFSILLNKNKKKPIVIKGKKEDYFVTEALMRTMRLIAKRRPKYNSK